MVPKIELVNAPMNKMSSDGPRRNTMNIGRGRLASRRIASSIRRCKALFDFSEDLGRKGVPEVKPSCA